MGRDGGGGDGAARGGVATILAVDDDPIQRELYGIYLSPPDLALITADCGETALTLLDRARFSGAVIDYDMPGMNGLELVRRLRADPRFAAQPIFLVTGRDDIVSRSSALQAGASDLVYKPVDWRELAVLVRAAVLG